MVIEKGSITRLNGPYISGIIADCPVSRTAAGRIMDSLSNLRYRHRIRLAMGHRISGKSAVTMK
jgi:hypothetical protein